MSLSDAAYLAASSMHLWARPIEMLLAAFVVGMLHLYASLVGE